MTVRVKVTPTGGAQTVTNVRATLELVERTAPREPTVPPEPVVVELVDSLTRQGSVAGSLILSHPAPDGTLEGDRMFVTWLCRSIDGFGGTDGTSTPDSAWTLVDRYTVGGTGYSSRFQANLYTKVADAADQAGTTIYEWEAGGTFTYGSLFCTSFASGGAWTLSTAVQDSGQDTVADLSVLAPGVGSALTFAVTRATRTNFGEVDIELDAGLLARSAFLTNTQGIHEHGQSSDGSAVGATVSGDNTNKRYQALFAVGLS
jgi:hypothetical protein